MSADPDRFQKYHLEACGLLLDYSRHYLHDSLRAAIFPAPRCEQAWQRLRAQFRGEEVNLSESQAATHTALRADGDDIFVNQSLNIIPESEDDILSWAADISSGRYQNAEGQSYSDYVHVGIGGSYLGPRLVCEALGSSQSSTRVHFLANVDPGELATLLPRLDLRRTLWGIASKSFGTLETQANFAALRSVLRARGEPEFANCLAITARVAKALELGFARDRILTLPASVGGRFSLWSGIGLPIALAAGVEAWRELRAGANQMDRHAYERSGAANMALVLAALDCYYLEAYSIGAQAVLAYSHRLRSFAEYYQQLSMESLGKSLSADGKRPVEVSGPVIFGGEGTNGQHAYHQLLHQGTQLIPCDFIVCAAGAKNGYFNARDMHRQLLANAVGQAQALALGAESEQAHQRVAGEKPSSIICLPQLDAQHLGALLALYEHRVALLGYLLDINPFDQWGVELGKRLAQDIYPHLETTDKDEASLLGWLRRRGA